MRKLIFLLTSLAFVLTSCQTQTSPTNNIVAGEPMVLDTFEVIRLLPPNLDCQVPLMTAAKNRRTDRVFAETNLSLQHLSDILWMANGVNRPDGRRTVPSAMALFPIDTYVFLANGVFFYNPDEHKLIPVLEGDFREKTGASRFATAPLNLVFIANYNRYAERDMSAEEKLWLASLDAAHSTQNVHLYAAAAGLKTVVRARVDGDVLIELLDLDPIMHRFIIAQTVGH